MDAERGLSSPLGRVVEVQAAELDRAERVKRRRVPVCDSDGVHSYVCVCAWGKREGGRRAWCVFVWLMGGFGVLESVCFV